MKGPWIDSEAPATEGQIIERAALLLAERLPPEWRLERVAPGSAGPRGAEVDAVFSIVPPAGGSTAIVVEAKRNVEVRDVPSLLGQIENLADRSGLAPAAGLVAARYLSLAVRRRLAAADLNYADATGNLYLSLRKPALFVRDVGADRDPWRGPGRPRDSFRGPIAARVVRALADFAPPMTVPELIERSGVSTGAGYRVVDFLERQDLLAHQPRKPITRVDWREILELWSRDYGLNLEAEDSAWLAPRGIQTVLSGLAGVEDVRYALTGSAGAAYFEEYAQTRLVMAYADEPAALAKRLGLRSAQAGANVLLVRPVDSVVYERTVRRDGVVVAAPSQLAGDLLNGPGRAPAEAEALLDWMQRNEFAWRERPSGSD